MLLFCVNCLRLYYANRINKQARELDDANDDVVNAVE